MEKCLDIRSFLKPAIGTSSRMAGWFGANNDSRCYYGPYRLARPPDAEFQCPPRHKICDTKASRKIVSERKSVEIPEIMRGC